MVPHVMAHFTHPGLPFLVCPEMPELSLQIMLSYRSHILVIVFLIPLPYQNDHRHFQKHRREASKSGNHSGRSAGYARLCDRHQHRSYHKQKHPRSMQKVSLPLPQPPVRLIQPEQVHGLVSFPVNDQNSDPEQCVHCIQPSAF